MQRCLCPICSGCVQVEPRDDLFHFVARFFSFEHCNWNLNPPFRRGEMMAQSELKVCNFTPIRSRIIMQFSVINRSAVDLRSIFPTNRCAHNWLAIAKLNRKDFRERTKNPQIVTCVRITWKDSPWITFTMIAATAECESLSRWISSELFEEKCFAFSWIYCSCLKSKIFAKLKAKDLSDPRDKIGECQWFFTLRP